jgi:hypothetical protein
LLTADFVRRPSLDPVITHPGITSEHFVRRLADKHTYGPVVYSRAAGRPSFDFLQTWRGRDASGGQRSRQASLRLRCLLARRGGKHTYQNIAESSNLNAMPPCSAWRDAARRARSKGWIGGRPSCSRYLTRERCGGPRDEWARPPPSMLSILIESAIFGKYACRRVGEAAASLRDCSHWPVYWSSRDAQRVRSKLRGGLNRTLTDDSLYGAFERPAGSPSEAARHTWGCTARHTRSHRLTARASVAGRASDVVVTEYSLM